jgi:hypothetical protein
MEYIDIKRECSEKTFIKPLEAFVFFFKKKPNLRLNPTRRAS